jgi:hypothetical protein
MAGLGQERPGDHTLEQDGGVGLGQGGATSGFRLEILGRDLLAVDRGDDLSAGSVLATAGRERREGDQTRTYQTPSPNG